MYIQVVVVGAGSAGLGVVFSLYHGMIAQGLKPEDAARRFYLIDNKGLITQKREGIAEGQKPFARTDLEDGKSLIDTIREVLLSCRMHR